jgi:uroporphyrinogen decarboxylase
MSSLLRIPVKPDVQGLRDWLLERKPQPRVHVAELFQDWPIQQAVAKRFGLCQGLNPADPIGAIKYQIELQSFLGYDQIRIQPPMPMSFFRTTTEDTADPTSGQSKGQRTWADEHAGPVSSWETFERFPWPRIESLDFSGFEWAEKNLPPGLGVYTLTAHILEYTTWLMGYETLCYKLHDEPDLVRAVFQRVGELSDAYSRTVCDFSRLSVLWGSDDMGFRGGTLIAAQTLIDLALPWHASSARIAHEHGRMYWLHSCGELREVMPTIIEQVKADAKHSWEDVIQPVEDAYRAYGSRIGILGGIDVDFLCRADEPAIRRRVRSVLDQCLPGGAYCLGTGNSVANYVPVDHYLIMLDEGRRYFA